MQDRLSYLVDIRIVALIVAKKSSDAIFLEFMTGFRGRYLAYLINRFSATTQQKITVPVTT